MAEIKTDKFTILEVGDGEFHLRMEEEMRDCLPCTYLAATAEDGKQYPAIMLRDRIKNKKAYMDTIVDSLWFLLQDRSKSIKLVILKLDFRGAGVMKFWFDLSPLSDSREENQLWFRYLLMSEGKVAIADGREPSFGATGITLNIPMMIAEDRI